MDGTATETAYLSRFPLARISSTICIDSARLTGPLPDIVKILFLPLGLASLFSVQPASKAGYISHLLGPHQYTTPHHTTTPHNDRDKEMK